MDQMTMTFESCTPNISAAGVRRRTGAAWMAAIVSVAGFAALAATGAGPAVRALIGFPVLATAICVLQVRRNTCVKHAAMGTFEHNDFSTTRANDVAAQQSRRVALTIWRDAGLFTLLAVAIAVSSGL